jgi:hypothetical protein
MLIYIVLETVYHESGQESDASNVSSHVQSLATANALQPNAAKRSAEMNSSREAALQNIEESIGRLHRLSMAIRQSGARTPQSRIANFTIVNEDGEDINDLFETFVDRVLQSRISNLSPGLRKRLATSICFRRRRFLYNISHRQKLGQRVQEPTTLAKRLPSTSRSKVIIPSSAVSTSTPKTIPLAPSKATESTPGTDSTLLAFDSKRLQLPIASTPSQASSAPSLSPLLQSTSEIPRAPRLHHGLTEEECPYCPFVLPARQFLGTRWKSVDERKTHAFHR